jgi:hypothetical protein
MDEKKKLIKIANGVQDALAKLREKRWLELLSCLTSLTGEFPQTASQARKLGLALTHSWLTAVQGSTTSINRSLDDLQYWMQRAKQLIEAPNAELAKLSFLVEELEQLQQEFESIDFDKAQNTISVITEPITLEEVYLGPFKIQLKIDKLSVLYTNCPYHCIALDPHPPATSEEVTHPHVSNDRLCEGEGNSAIRAALEQGRLCDFFTIVRSILNTYSPDSPYVRLDEWDGQACYECGYVTDGENSYYCSFCDQSFCEECSTCCRSCNETVCNSCSQLCAYCEESVCPNCIKECPECKRLYCSSCLEEDLCPNCKEEPENENEQHPNQNARTDKDRSPRQPETTQPEIQHSS